MIFGILTCLAGGVISIMDELSICFSSWKSVYLRSKMLFFFIFSMIKITLCPFLFICSTVACAGVNSVRIVDKGSFSSYVHKDDLRVENEYVLLVGIILHLLLRTRLRGCAFKKKVAQ